MPARRRRPNATRPPHRHDNGDLIELEVAALELEAELLLLAEDVLRGRIPRRARRAMFDHEDRAGVNFAAIERDVDDRAGRIAARVAGGRSAMVRRILADIERAGREGYADGLGTTAMARRLVSYADPSMVSSVVRELDAGRLVDAAFNDVRGELERAVRVGGNRVLAEARAQGVPGIPDHFGRIPDDVAEALDRHALRLAAVVTTSPLDAASRFAYDRAVFAMTERELLDELEAHLDKLALPLDPSRQAVQQADGMGRQAAAPAVPRPATIYASELLDGSTCGPCSLIDGVEFHTELDARREYPTGTYRYCEGGARCRGTLVYVWPDEADPTNRVDPTPPPPPPIVPPPVTPPGAVPPAPAPPDRTPPARGGTFVDRVAELRALRPAEWVPAITPDLDAVAKAARLAERASHERLIGQIGELVDDEVERRLAALGPRVAELEERLVAARLEEDAAREALFARPPAPPMADADARRAWNEASQAIRVRVADARAARGALEAERVELRAGVARDVLAELRPMGPASSPGGRSLPYSKGSAVKGGIEKLEEVVGFYPREWLEAFNSGPRIKVTKARRGFHRQSYGAKNESQIALSEGSETVAIHELGHHAEEVIPAIRRLEREFYRRRTTLADGTIEPLVGRAGYGPSERFREDKFVNVYMGKDYGGGDAGYFELLSMGMEGVFRGSNGHLLEDRDFRRFILGLLAGV